MSSMAALVVLGLSCSIPSHHGQQEGDMSQVPAPASDTIRDAEHCWHPAREGTRFAVQQHSLTGCALCHRKAGSRAEED